MKPSKESSAPRPPEACIRCRQITMACATPHSHGPMISTAKSQLFSVSQSRSQALVRDAFFFARVSEAFRPQPPWAFSVLMMSNMGR